MRKGPVMGKRPSGFLKGIEEASVETVVAVRRQGQTRPGRALRAVGTSWDLF